MSKEIKILMSVFRDRGEGDDDLEVEVTLEHTPASRGARDSCGGVAGAGPQLEPDEPDEMTFLSAIIPSTKEVIELTEEEKSDAESLGFKKLEQQWDGPDE